MKQILLIFSLILLMASKCQNDTVNMNVDDNGIEQKTMIVMEDTLNKRSLDSLFIADSISPNIEHDWIESISITENRMNMLYKYVYIKELTDSTGTIYTLCTYNDSLYIISKRTTK